MKILKNIFQLLKNHYNFYFFKIFVSIKNNFLKYLYL